MVYQEADSIRNTKQINPIIIKNRAAIKHLCSKETDGFISKFDQTLKEQTIPFLHKLLHGKGSGGIYIQPG